MSLNCLYNCVLSFPPLLKIEKTRQSYCLWRPTLKAPGVGQKLTQRHWRVYVVYKVFRWLRPYYGSGLPSRQYKVQRETGRQCSQTNVTLQKTSGNSAVNSIWNRLNLAGDIQVKRVLLGGPSVGKKASEHLTVAALIDKVSFIR